MRKSLLLGLVLLAGFTAGQVLSKDDPNRPNEEMIKAHEKLATPGPEHARLRALEGNFEARVRATLDPAAVAKESVGKCEERIIFGGLFAREDFEGVCPITGKAMKGLGYLGYDNGKKKFVATWLDSMASGIFLSEGTADASGNVITFYGKCTDAVTGKDVNIREVLTIVSDRKHTFELFRPGPDGKEFLALEITYLKK